jgi:hypothetical protein
MTKTAGKEVGGEKRREDKRDWTKIKRNIPRV